MRDCRSQDDDGEPRKEINSPEHIGCGIGSSDSPLPSPYSLSFLSLLLVISFSIPIRLLFCPIPSPLSFQYPSFQQVAEIPGTFILVAGRNPLITGSRSRLVALVQGFRSSIVAHFGDIFRHSGRFRSSSLLKAHHFFGKDKGNLWQGGSVSSKHRDSY